jgi:hypothetical protein
VTSAARCCRYEWAPSFGWSQQTAQQIGWGLPTEDPTNVEYIESHAGMILFFFSTNQFVNSNGQPSLSSSNPDWSFASGYGSSTSNFEFVAEPHVSSSSNTPVLSPGDVATASFVVNAAVTGQQDVTVSGAVTLTTAVDPGPDTPAISEVSFGPLSSSAPSLVKVRFDTTRPLADVIEIGSWNNFPVSVPVNDLGVGADQVACDGWFSGTVTLPAGSYEVLARARNTATSKVGPYFRKTVVVF